MTRKGRWVAIFVDTSLHQLGVARWLAAGRRQLSLVDCVSFEAMQRFGLERVFCFDQDFETEGFTRVP